MRYYGIHTKEMPKHLLICMLYTISYTTFSNAACTSNAIIKWLKWYCNLKEEKIEMKYRENDMNANAEHNKHLIHIFILFGVSISFSLECIFNSLEIGLSKFIGATCSKANIIAAICLMKKKLIKNEKCENRSNSNNSIAIQIEEKINKHHKIHSN